jgi:hypothetical protein
MEAGTLEQRVNQVPNDDLSLGADPWFGIGAMRRNKVFRELQPPYGSSPRHEH